MTKTNTALREIITNFFETQAEFAELADVDRTALNRDTSKQPVTDDRFRAYLRILAPETREKLLTARMMDLVPEELHAELLFKLGNEPGDFVVKEELAARMPPSLTDDQIKILTFFANEMISDPSVSDLLYHQAKAIHGYDPIKGELHDPIKERRKVKY